MALEIFSNFTQLCIQMQIPRNFLQKVFFPRFSRSFFQLILFYHFHSTLKIHSIFIIYFFTIGFSGKSHKIFSSRFKSNGLRYSLNDVRSELNQNYVTVLSRAQTHWSIHCLYTIRFTLICRIDFVKSIWLTINHDQIFVSIFHCFAFALHIILSSIPISY